MTKTITLVAVSSMLVGCGTMVPQQRQETATSRYVDTLGQKSVGEFAGKIDPSFWPSVTVSNIGKGSVSVAMPAHKEVNATVSSKGQAGSQDFLSWDSIVSIPLGVKLILLAMGIYGVVMVLKYVRKSSASVNAAWQAADQSLARQITKLRNRATTTSNPMEMAQLNADISDAEAERGKMAAQKGKL